VEGVFTLAPALGEVPEPGDAPSAKALALTPRGGWAADRRFGRVVFALSPHEDGYSCALIDEEEERLIPVEPEITGPTFQFELSLDGRRLLVAHGKKLLEVDTATGQASPVISRGDLVVTVSFLGDLMLVIRRKEEYEGRLDIYRRAGGKPEKIATVDCGRLDGLGMLHDGRAALLFYQHAGPDDTWASLLVGLGPDGKAGYLGRIDAPMKRAWTAQGRSFVADVAGAVFELHGLEEALAEPRELEELASDAPA
jgi:hypothetical protein